MPDRPRRWTQAAELRERDPAGLRRARPGRRWRATARRWWQFQDAGAVVVRLRQQPAHRGEDRRLRARLRLPRLRARLRAAAVLPRHRPLPLGGAVAATPTTSPPPTPRCASCSPTTRGCSAGSTRPRQRIAFQGLPARICWIGYGDRHRAGLRFNELVRSGEVHGADRDRARPPRLAAPSRRRTARPSRCATAPTRSPTGRILNAMLNVGSGAAWVAVHHGGGVGIGRSIHSRRAGRRRRHRRRGAARSSAC